MAEEKLTGERVKINFFLIVSIVSFDEINTQIPMIFLTHFYFYSFNSPAQCAGGPDGQILPMKKTDEDYFSGTRESKKLKKKKLKKPKTVLTLETLDDLINSSSPDLNEEPNPCSNTSNSEENSLQTIVPGDIVWSKDESTADKLFPNVQSVVIDRNDEEEMLTEALAESVATLQLESIKRQTIFDKNRWEGALYGDADDEDEGGW